MEKPDKEEETKRLCAYCHLPPKEGKKLKRCSICRNAWYHDADCQRKDFPKHKKNCRTKNKNECIAQYKGSYEASFVVEEREGRGKCLVAVRDICKGSRISPSNGWYPIVAPVLNEQYRTSRCALCFKPLTQQILCYEDIPSNPLYRLLYCSSNCRTVASKEHNLELEERAISNLCRNSNHAPPSILPTAILVYRIILKQRNLVIRSTIEELLCNSRRDEAQKESQPKSDSRTYHSQGVIATVMGMVQYSESTVKGSIAELPSMEYVSETIQRIQLNGFSLCDEEFVSYGVGLYHPASCMNHSCRPNALQTFEFRAGQPPTLHVTAYEDVASNQEICISYTDTSCPGHIRQEQLRDNYFFECSCEACMNVQNDATKKMGLRCLHCISGHNSVVTEKSIKPERAFRQYRCMECGYTDFASTLAVLDSVEEGIINHFQDYSSDRLLKTYGNAKQHCSMSSWYVQQSGEALLQSHLNNLSEHRGNPQGEQKAAWDALNLAGELLEGLDNDGETLPLTTSEFLRWQQLRYKAAKLRLFVEPDPRQSIHELQDILSSLLVYYLKDHQLIVGLQATLQNALM